MTGSHETDLFGKMVSLLEAKKTQIDERELADRVLNVGASWH